MLNNLDAINILNPFDNILVGGQPSEQDFEKMKDAGFTTIINLRPASESVSFDQSALLSKLGLKYIQIPVDGPSGVHKDNAEKLHLALSNNEGNTLVHCASGNRVGALFALRSFYFEEKSIEEALAIGKKAGLTKLEGHVINYLSAK